MKFIELRPGVSVAICSITGVDRNEFAGIQGSMVYSDLRAVESTIPYETLLQILEKYEILEKNKGNNVNTPQKNLWGAQHFAG